MNIQIFGTTKCFDTKKAQRYFKERGIKFQMIDLKEKEMSRGEFENVARALGGWEQLLLLSGTATSTPFLFLFGIICRQGVARRLVRLADDTSRGAPTRIVRVVGADVAARAHVPRIAPVAAIRTTQADTLRTCLCFDTISNTFRVCSVLCLWAYRSCGSLPVLPVFALYSFKLWYYVNLFKRRQKDFIVCYFCVAVCLIGYGI